MRSKDDEVRQIVAELETRISEMKESVAALAAILNPPPADGEDQDRDRASSR